MVRRNAIAWVVAAVTLAKRGLAGGPAAHEDECRIARALTLPRDPFLEAGRDLNFEVAELAVAFAVTKDEVLARLAEVGSA